MAVNDNKIKFEKDQIVTFDEKTNFDHVINTLAKVLIEKDLVKSEYPKQVILREQKFPTGLPTKPFGVSIPHTDAKWTKHNAIAIGILKSPIEQVVMGSDETKIGVEIVFMLALDKSNKQLNILSKLMNIFQDPENLVKIRNSSKDEILKIVNKVILEEK